MARFWREAGYRVEYLFGPAPAANADICIVHVDVSVVHQDYLSFAGEFSTSLNGQLRDIRKRVISGNLVDADTDYKGSVIVKTDLNHGGWPEITVRWGRTATRFMKRLNRWTRFPPGVLARERYQIYANVSEVPAIFFEDARFVVEKFLPEIREDLFCINYYKFFGSVHECGRNYSAHPLVMSSASVRRDHIEPEPDVVKLRHAIGMDFGKIDYTVAGGKAIVLDVNKTPGRRRHSKVPMEYLARRAEAIRQYL